jgi:hypothetical protein
MSDVYGNVNVAYKPCKSVGQLKAADQYMLGQMKNQIAEGITKTQPHIYDAMLCNRENFSNSLLITRKMHHKSYSKLQPKDILAHKLSLSFHPLDNDKLTYEQAFAIGQEFAQKFFGDKGFEALFEVHTDTEHVHIHFLISNCNLHTGKAFRRNQRDLAEMSAYFGHQCRCHGLEHSVRDTFYSQTPTRDKLTFPEHQMRAQGRESFKDELREVIQLEVGHSKNHSFGDVVQALKRKYGVETRVAGNTVSYRHPEYKDKNGNLIAVRASKLGDFYTRKGITYELNQSRNRENSNRGKESEQVTTTRQVDQRETKLLQSDVRQGSNAARARNGQIRRSGNGQRRTDVTPNTGRDTGCADTRKRIVHTENPVSSIIGTGETLSRTLSEIRTYNTRFDPGKSGGKQGTVKGDGREDHRAKVLQPDTAKPAKKRSQSRSR